MHRLIIRKLNKRHFHSIGVTSLSKVVRRLEILDKVLALFGMRVGAYQTADLDIHDDLIVSARLTIYFMEK